MADATFNNEKSIAELIALARSNDLAVSGVAGRQLMRRAAECGPHAVEIVGLLQVGNAAIEDMAFHTLDRMGAAAVPALLKALPGATGRFRAYIISLLPLVADFDAWFPILSAEFNGADEGRRFHAARCIVCRSDEAKSWPDPALATWTSCVEALRACLTNPDADQYRVFARITLRTQGLLDGEPPSARVGE